MLHDMPVANSLISVGDSQYSFVLLYVYGYVAMCAWYYILVPLQLTKLQQTIS